MESFILFRLEEFEIDEFGHACEVRPCGLYTLPAVKRAIESKNLVPLVYDDEDDIQYAAQDFACRVSLVMERKITEEDVAFDSLFSFDTLGLNEKKKYYIVTKISAHGDVSEIDPNTTMNSFVTL